MKGVPETPLRIGLYETGCNYRVIVTPTKLLLCRNMRIMIGGVSLIILAFVIPVIVGKFLTRWNITMPKEISVAIRAIFAFGGLVTLVADFLVRRYSRGYEFDTRNRTLRILKRKSVESEIDLSDVKALQLAYAHFIKHFFLGKQYHAKYVWWSYELNLVYLTRQGLRRRNLICAAGRRGILKPGKILAERLGVPLLDHATPEHRMKEKRRSRTSASSGRGQAAPLKLMAGELRSAEVSCPSKCGSGRFVRRA